MSDSLWPHESQHARPPCPSPLPGACSNLCPSSQWCHSTISSSVIPFSSWLQSFPASGSFPMSQFFAWGGQSFGASASTSILPMNIQDWFPLGWTGWISLPSKGLSRVIFNTTVQNHQFFGAQFSFLNSLIAQSVKNLPAMQETLVQSLSGKEPLKKEMASHSSILARRISWTEEPGGLQFMRPQRIRHDWMAEHSSTHNCKLLSKYVISVSSALNHFCWS